MVMERTTCRNFNSGLAFHAPENLKIQLKCSYVLMNCFNAGNSLACFDSREF